MRSGIFLFFILAFGTMSAARTCWEVARHGHKTTRCHCKGDECTDLALATDCTALPRCNSIAGTGAVTGCGWCWASELTEQRGEQTGGRLGTSAGPSNGTCADWTFYSAQCFQHVDCEGDVNSCVGIMGTYCGWCETDTGGKAHRGTATSSFCQEAGGKWVWDHGDCARPSDRPEQIRLSIADQAAKVYAVTWATFARGGANSGVIVWGDAGGQLHVPAETSEFSETNSAGFQFVHRAFINGTQLGLKPGNFYSYNVSWCPPTAMAGTECATEGPFRFRYDRPFAGDAPFSALLFGDMGRHGGGQVMHQLKKEVQGRGVTSAVSPDVLIHIGDFAYDLQTSDGLNGDTFLQRIQPLATAVPYMVCPGNHEIQTGGNESNPGYFAHYRNRFTVPRGISQDGRGVEMWFSWNQGPVHFVSFSTEVYFAASAATQQRMEAWLVSDLKEANSLANRQSQPWIVAFGHRPFRCSNTDGDDCTRDSSVVRAALEELFHEGKVDLVFEAHEHSYERLFPVYGSKTQTFAQQCRNDVGCQGITHYDNPSAGVHIISGAAGCNEDSGACLNPIVKSRGDWSAFWLQAQGTYSYGRLTVHNASALEWQNVLAEQEMVVDHLLITKATAEPRFIGWL